MSGRRILLLLLIVAGFLMMAAMPFKPQYWGQIAQATDLIVGRNVNMVAGMELPDGDPYLQRQNEPSFAVSTRNPLHLLAGANDYRTVDMPESEGPLPGIPEGATAGDAWLGVFKSFNGGQSWISTLHPGYPQGNSNSPLQGFSAASDPTVRSGTNGLFYYSGIAFDRDEQGRGVLFVSRFIDNNFTQIGDTDPIKFIDTKIVDEGTPGQFADKPWIAVDAPRYGASTIPIQTQMRTQSLPPQDIARHNVYIVYSIFQGNLAGGDQSKILFSRSTDCGTTWEKPIKISEGQHRNQGTVIDVSPLDGTIYVAWRRFGSPSQPDAILVCKSEDFGLTFNKPSEISPINPFDQFTGVNRFRTYAFPTMAVDDTGIVYVAWADVGFAPPYARIVIVTSPDGIGWSIPKPIDIHIDHGHQIMPALNFAAGKLMMTWYDTRKSQGAIDSNGNLMGHYAFIEDVNTPSGNRHTMDVRIAHALPSSNPIFTRDNPFLDSVQVSKYLHWIKMDGEVIAQPVQFKQKEWNPPNYPLFMGGTRPFVGDYIDIAATSTFLFDIPNLNKQQNGHWRFNTDVGDPDTFHVTWTDNRDVHTPSDGNWTKYNPPTVVGSTVPCTNGTRTGMRNQNIYTSAITQGVMIGSPVNTKPLIAPPSSTFRANSETYVQKRTFPIFVKNFTDTPKYFELTLDSPDGMNASFWEFGPPDPANCELWHCGDGSYVQVLVEAHSLINLTVFVVPYPANPYATFRVLVEEFNGADFYDYIVLNPDPVNTRIVPVLAEYHTPTVEIGLPTHVHLDDARMLSESIVYTPENLDYALNFANPDIVAPAFRSPAFRSGNIVNPAFRSTTLGDVPDGEVTDLQWKITNNNDVTTAYSFVPIGDPTILNQQGVEYQLLIYRVNNTPDSFYETSPDNCQLVGVEHHELLYSSPAFRSPAFRSPAFRSPAFRSPAFRSNTLSLAPGEEAICTLRFIDPDPPVEAGQRSQGLGILNNGTPVNEFIPEVFATTVAAAVVPQAANPDGIIEVATSLYIIDSVLPAGSLNVSYETIQLEAYGGTPFHIYDNGIEEDPTDDIWEYQHWSEPGGFLPPGLSLSALGVISETPLFDPKATYPQDYYFTVEVKDESDPQQIAHRMFKITIDCDAVITATATDGGTIYPAGEIHVDCGTSQTFNIRTSDACYDIADVIVDGVSVGAVSSYTFTNVTQDHTINAIFVRKTFPITATASQGGTINPLGVTEVLCGLDQAFEIIPDDGYQLMFIFVDGQQVDIENLDSSKYAFTQDPKNANAYTFTFKTVGASHTIHAGFGWVRRYNNDPVNGDDKVNDAAVDLLGNILVAGYSEGKTTGPDFFTISYDRAGNTLMSARSDGPSHEGDYANAIAVGESGSFYETGSSFRGIPHKHSDYYTVKHDSSGDEVWDVRFDAQRNGNDVANAIAFKSGYVYVTGGSEDSESKKSDVLHRDYYTIKYEVNRGREVWGARYDNSIMGQDEATDIAVDSSGNVYVTGKSQGDGTGFDYATLKYDPEGELDITWGDGGIARFDGENGDDEAVALALVEDQSGNVYVYVTGKSQGNETGLDYATLKYGLNGQLDTTWGDGGVARYHGGIGADEAVALALDSLGNAYVTGRSQGSGSGQDLFTIKYDSSGNVIWSARYNNNDPPNNADEAVDIAVFEDQGYIHVYVVGKSQGDQTGYDFVTIKYEQ